MQGPVNFSNILVDDLAIYKRALSDQEVMQLYNATCNDAELVVTSACTVSVPDAFVAGEKVYVLIDGVQHFVAEYIGPGNTVEQCLQKVATGLTNLGLSCTQANGSITVPAWPSNWEWDTPGDIALLDCGGKWENYRFGFQRQEKDDETHGATGTSYAFTFRSYDSRIGRFLSMDPVGQCFPFRTPYDISANNPIWFMDWDGLQPVTRNFTYSGQNFTFSTNLDTPQDFSISGSAFDFRSRDEGHENGNSLALLKGGHSQLLKMTGGGLAIDVKRLMLTSLHHVRVASLLLAVLSQNPDLHLAIIGNHDVPTYDEAPGNPLQKLERSSLRTKGGQVMFTSDQRTPENEATWTRDRANFVNRKFFNNSNLITTLSRGDIPGTSFNGFPLPPLGRDAVGITIAFDFSGTTPDATTPASPPPNGNNKDAPTIYHHPRFL